MATLLAITRLEKHKNLILKFHHGKIKRLSKIPTKHNAPVIPKPIRVIMRIWGILQTRKNPIFMTHRMRKMATRTAIGKQAKAMMNIHVSSISFPFC